MIPFNNGKSSIIAAFLAIITSFNFVEVDPELYQIEESAIFSQDSKFVFNYLIDSQHIPEVFTFILSFFYYFALSYLIFSTFIWLIGLWKRNQMKK